MSYGPRPLYVSWKQPADEWGGVITSDFWDPLFVRGEPITALVTWPLVVTPGCECGLEVHPGESCEGALACVQAMLEGCTCSGYWNPDTRAVEHDGFCDLVFECPLDGCGCVLCEDARADGHDGAHVFAGPCEAVS